MTTGIAQKYRAALSKIVDLEQKLGEALRDRDTERELRKTHEVTIGRLEAFRASWQGRCATAEREARQTTEQLLQTSQERDAAEAKLIEIATTLDVSELEETAA